MGEERRFCEYIWRIYRFEIKAEALGDVWGHKLHMYTHTGI